METIVFFPVPGLSHLISTVELAKLILSHSNSDSLSVTFLLPTFPFTTDNSIPSYTSSVSSSFPSITFHSLPPTPPTKNTSDYANIEELMFDTLRSNTTNVRNALHSVSESGHSISAFILDFFCYTALDIARSFDIPSYFFFTSNAACLAFFLNLPVINSTTNLPFRNNPISFDIPGLFTMTSDHMIDAMLDRGTSFREFVSMGEALAKANGVIVNTFDELEPRAVMALKEGTCLPGRLVPPIYCIGPLVPSIDDQRHECLGWLDSQPNRSVVFLAFGQHGRFSKEQTREIAIGLERSGERFLWVVRSPPNEEFTPTGELELGSLLPEGFLERTKDRGLVVKSWAPQLAVLNRESVGGFVTHCGWNSSLEAVSAGVPMIAWPLYAEQKFNKIVLVEELGVALPMEDSTNRFVSAIEVERRVKQLMNSEDGEMVRNNVSKMKEEAIKASSEGGSSEMAMFNLVESWKR